MDVDSGGLPTRYEAATDGVLVLRYLLGLRGSALVNDARWRRRPRRCAKLPLISMPAIGRDGCRWRRRRTRHVRRVAHPALHARPAWHRADLAGANHGLVTAPQIETALLTTDAATGTVDGSGPVSATSAEQMRERARTAASPWFSPFTVASPRKSRVTPAMALTLTMVPR